MLAKMVSGTLHSCPTQLICTVSSPSTADTNTPEALAACARLQPQHTAHSCSGRLASLCGARASALEHLMSSAKEQSVEGRLTTSATAKEASNGTRSEQPSPSGTIRKVPEGGGPGIQPYSGSSLPTSVSACPAGFAESAVPCRHVVREC